jgi:hypothetical protein
MIREPARTERAARAAPAARLAPAAKGVRVEPEEPAAPVRLAIVDRRPRSATATDQPAAGKRVPGQHRQHGAEPRAVPANLGLRRRAGRGDFSNVAIHSRSAHESQPRGLSRHRQRRADTHLELGSIESRHHSANADVRLRQLRRKRSRSFEPDRRWALLRRLVVQLRGAGPVDERCDRPLERSDRCSAVARDSHRVPARGHGFRRRQPVRRYGIG